MATAYIDLKTLHQAAIQISQEIFPRDSFAQSVTIARDNQTSDDPVMESETSPRDENISSRITDYAGTQPAPEASQIAPEASHVTPGASQIAPEASQITPGDSQIAPEASQVKPGDSQILDSFCKKTVVDIIEKPVIGIIEKSVIDIIEKPVIGIIEKSVIDIIEKTVVGIIEKPVIDIIEKPVIGIIKDSAFQFYYPDNLEALEAMGAELKFISPLSEKSIPPVDAVYMGGGFPETHAAQLADNESFRKELKSLAARGLPIYAECGGLIFLGKSLTLETHTYPMADILPLNFGLSKRPVGHGYTTVEVVNPNPFYEVGQVIRGHEFRYSSVLDIDYKETEMAFAMKRGKGIIHKKDGFFKNNVFGTYTHIMASGTPVWARAIVKAAISYMKQQNYEIK
ncbi:MAG: hypothetical protein HQK66_02030 [Desulfamplus sp.]|nr:hypothetical protein [Desulfamplus sp.]